MIGFGSKVTYDDAERHRSTTDATGRVTSKERNVKDQLLRTIDSAGRVSTTVHDAQDRPTDTYGPAPGHCFIGEVPTAACAGIVPREHTTNVIAFALWYWECDRGGPIARAAGRRPRLDFRFPQMEDPDGHLDWEPHFLDYFYLSFTNATAFSPTDVMPMSRWAKMLMLSQSAVSLVTLAVVISRAVSLFK